MWIDMELQRPANGERVIVLLPFGMRVDDDTWTDDSGWLNHACGYISHWQPINPPGTYQEIMERPKGTLPDVPRVKMAETPDWFGPAIFEHMKMMDQILMTQLAIRFPGKRTGEDRNEDGP